MVFYPYNGDYFNGITRQLKRAESIDGIVYVSTTNSSHVVDESNWGDSDVILNDKTDRQNIFASKNINNSYVIINFHKHRVKLTSYTISSRYGTEDKLTDWNLTGSNDKIHWQLIDEKSTNELVPDLAYKNYNVFCGNAFQYFRIMQKAPATVRNSIKS